MTEKRKVYISRIGRGNGFKAQFIYIDLRNASGELMVSATADYVMDWLERTNSEIEYLTPTV
jgi:hypothetical protein